MRFLSFAVIAGLAAIAAPLIAQNQQAPYVIEETGQGFARLDQAVHAIGNARATIIVAPGRHRQCAIQEAGIITYRAAEPGTAIFDGVACEGKAALVLRGTGAVVDGLVFENMAVPDENGAGIRIEQGNLDVRNSMFRNSEQGILSAEDRDATIRIDRSTFSGLGRCGGDASCAHSIYIGNYGRLEVTRSRFERGNGGHYVKTHTAQVSITDNSFDDTQGQATNYMIDLPSGSQGTIANNVFVQGENKENWSAFVAVAAEGQHHSSSGLVISNNSASLAPGVRRETWFVGDWSGDQLQIASNQLGRGISPYHRR